MWEAEKKALKKVDWYFTPLFEHFRNLCVSNNKSTGPLQRDALGGINFTQSSPNKFKKISLVK